MNQFDLQTETAHTDGGFWRIIKDRNKFAQICGVIIYRSRAPLARSKTPRADADARPSSRLRRRFYCTELMV
jgi:hypothetical protein